MAAERLEGQKEFISDSLINQGVSSAPETSKQQEDVVQEIMKQLKVALSIKSSYSRPFGLDHPNNDNHNFGGSFDMISCDQVYPNVLIGNGFAATNEIYLEKAKITHVLNAAVGTIKTSKEFYKDMGINYLGYDIIDSRNTEISKHFKEAADFIEEAVSAGGRVMVHCKEGISRSSTLVIAYLMIKKSMSVQDALSSVKKLHYIRPNRGFLRQLAELELRLRRQ